MFRSLSCLGLDLFSFEDLPDKLKCIMVNVDERAATHLYRAPRCLFTIHLYLGFASKFIKGKDKGSENIMLFKNFSS